MKPIKFAGSTHTLAESQPEYQPLPIHKGLTEERIVTSCWQLDDVEIATLIRTRQLWLQQLTFGALLQPQLPSVDKPELT